MHLINRLMYIDAIIDLEGSSTQALDNKISKVSSSLIVSVLIVPSWLDKRVVSLVTRLTKEGILVKISDPKEELNVNK